MRESFWQKCGHKKLWIIDRNETQPDYNMHIAHTTYHITWSPAVAKKDK